MVIWLGENGLCQTEADGYIEGDGYLGATVISECTNVDRENLSVPRHQKQTLNIPEVSCTYSCVGTITEGIPIVWSVQIQYLFFIAIIFYVPLCCRSSISNHLRADWHCGRFYLPIYYPTSHQSVWCDATVLPNLCDRTVFQKNITST